MKTQTTTRSMPTTMGATAALAFGSPAVLAIAGATAASTYAWRMAMAGPYMAMRFGKSTPGDLVKASAKQAEAVVDATLKAVEEATDAAAEVAETAVEASVEVAEEIVEAVAETAEAATVVEMPVAAEAVVEVAPVVETAPVEAEPKAKKPKSMKAPRKSGADDLTAIKGIGPKLAEKLGDMGIYHYSQIASWTEAEVAWMDENLGRPTGRCSRNNWVASAADLS